MDAPIAIRLFGGFAVSVGATAVPDSAWRLRKAKSLVKLLALAPERRVHRERATELLWPERTAEAAANNFHQAVYVARRALAAAGVEPSAALALRDDMLMLLPEGTVDIDVEAFEDAAARAIATRELRDYRTALDLHGGELLPEDRYETWVTARRDALTESHLRLLVDMAELLADRGEDGTAIDALEQVVVLDPLHEAAHRGLMRLFAAGGRRQQALAQYHQLRDALRRELEADPDPQTRELYRTLLRGGEQPRRVAPVDTAAHNFPAPLTSFVGRGRELGDVARLLDSHRLVTLIGAGGAGKTRLAVEAARARAASGTDGAWLVELGGLRDPELVAATTAAALGLTLPSQRLDLEGLTARLREWRALIVLDNCEHVVAACALLADGLLGACPGVRILATSRESLRAPGEVTWRVPSLALPAPEEAADPAELAACESVRLFCDRAGAANPGFALDARNAPAVAEICRRLDGMPLALELAAARAASLSPAQIAARLGDSLAVLTAGSRAALDRQQTLRATLEWSHRLLADAEPVLFRRLAAFAGTFTLEAAEHVTAGDDLPERDVADLLGRLVDKSLVVAEDAADGYRYRMLEPMRQFALERLSAAGEAGTLQSCHLRFYLELARAADGDAVAAETRGAHRRLLTEHDNLRAALAWAIRNDPQQALRLAVHMWPMWMAASLYREGSRWVEAALAAAPAPTRLRAEALRAACSLAIRLGRTAELSGPGRERVDIFRGLDDREAAAHALDELGVYEYMASRYDRAERLYSESRALGRELRDPKVVATALYSSAMLAHCRADFARAEAALLESIDHLRAVSEDDRDRFFRAHTVGLFVGEEGPGGAPRMYFEDTLQHFRRVDARGAIGYALTGLGDVARAQGLRDRARDELLASLHQFRALGDPAGTAFALNRLGNLAGVLGDGELGKEWLDEALELRRALGEQRPVSVTLANIGLLAARTGDVERGRATIGEALAMFDETGDPPGQMGMRLSLGNIAADAGDHDAACELLDASGAWAEQLRLFRAAGWIRLTMGEVAAAAGDAERAAALVHAAVRHLRPLRDRWGLGRCLELGGDAAKSSLSGLGEGGHVRSPGPRSSS